MIPITSIGGIARGLLEQEKEGSIVGVTSRGYFLSLGKRWVIFLSTESFRGPLTLNCPGYAGDLAPLRSGMAAMISPNQIFVPNVGLMIDATQAKSWVALPPTQGAQSLPGRKSMLAGVVKEALGKGKTSPIGELLPALSGLSDSSSIQGKAIPQHLQRLKGEILLGEPAFIEDLQVLLGLGTGLTPSGDDLLLGFFLTLARWGHVLAPGLDLQSLSGTILPLCYQKTTTLSANLIECALGGQANERLILALDGIMTGNEEAAACADYLAGWGNTSGLDALAGMALAMGDLI